MWRHRDMTSRNRLLSALTLLKLDIRSFVKSLRAAPQYLRDRREYLQKEDTDAWPVKIYPILLDRDEPSATLGEYFWQDLFVAKEIIKHDPDRHIDVGSRVDGFIGHLACVRRVEVFDIRPLSVTIPGVDFIQWDMTNPNPAYVGVADCVSCLHTLEHIGLGRYGDTIDPDGWRLALSALGQLLKPGGRLWVSVPVGHQRVEFNAHRVFHPATIVDAARDRMLSLDRVIRVTEQGAREAYTLEDEIARLAREPYALGVFCFVKEPRTP